MSMISDCCSYPADSEMVDYGICGDCKEHCSFIDEELEPYESWQLEKFGNILPTPKEVTKEVFETEDESERRFRDWEAVREIENENKTYLK